MTVAEETPPAAPPAPGSGYRKMFALAWPIALSNSSIALFLIANLFWIGHLGTTAVAAVSLCGHVLFILFGLTQIVNAGTVALVSRAVGAGRGEEAWDASLHAIVLGVGMGLTLGLLAPFLAPPIIHFFGVSSAVDALAIPYLEISLFSQTLIFLGMAMSASYQAAGNTRTPMWINIGAVTLNVIIDPLFIFAPGEREILGFDIGWLGLGVSGAAWADIVAHICGMSFFVGWSWYRSWPFPKPDTAKLRLRLDQFWRILQVGVPASVSMMARPVSTFFLLKVIASFGDSAVAAFGVALRAFNINWIFLAGLTAAVSTLVGQNLGARRPEAAVRVVRRGLRVSISLGILFVFVYSSIAEQFIGFFDSSPVVVEVGARFLRILAFSMWASSATVPLVAAMNGAGDTKAPMIAAFVSNWVIKLPLAWALAVPFGYGLDGVWVGLFVSILLEAALIVAWYRTGRWKTKEI
ncbi:MAG: MATE family efflux transporter [Deltaproteobacteria bacterium]